MIDIENKILNDVFVAARSIYPGISCYGEYVSEPASFPCITLYEANNYTYRRSQDSSLGEHHAHVMYECNVYSDKQSGKKAEARKIAKLVDSLMQLQKFTRTLYQVTPNLDRTIFRITMRWEAIVGDPIVTDGNNTKYSMYRE